MSEACRKNEQTQPCPRLRVVQVRPQKLDANQASGQMAEASPAPAPGRAPCQELCKGVVTGGSGGIWFVALQDTGAVLGTQRAAGCLLQPQPQDLVLVLQDHAQGEHYLLQVLRSESAASCLDFPGDVTIQAPQGRCTLQGEELELAAQGQARLVSAELDLEATRGRMRFATLDLLARELGVGFQHLQGVGARVQLIAASLNTRLGRVLRSVGFELHKARHLRTEVEGRCTLKADKAAILAKEEVTVDAEKINLG